MVDLTVCQALEKANLKEGQKLFTKARSGDVGTTAIQLAKHTEATVATTSTDNSNWVKNSQYEKMF